jgi:hypothetical protein
MESEGQSKSIEMLFALNQISDKNAERRAWAEEHIRKHGSSLTASLVATIENEGLKRRRRRKVLNWSVGIYGGFVLGFILWYLVRGLWTGHWGNFPFGMFRIFNFASLAGIFVASSGAQKSAARALALLDDPKTVGALAEALEYSDLDVETVARNALIRNLPLLKASNAEFLSDDQRKCLHRVFLKADQDLKLGMAILAALDQVGDDRDVSAVKKLTEAEAATSNEKKLQEKAKEILPGLEERAEMSRVANTLLRASSTPASEVTLLRPAQDTGETCEAQLLRPANEGTPQ